MLAAGALAPGDPSPSLLWLVMLAGVVAVWGLGAVLAPGLAPSTQLQLVGHPLRITRTRPLRRPAVELSAEAIDAPEHVGTALVLSAPDQRLRIPVGSDPADAIHVVIERIRGLQTRLSRLSEAERPDRAGPAQVAALSQLRHRVPARSGEG